MSDKVRRGVGEIPEKMFQAVETTAGAALNVCSIPRGTEAQKASFCLVRTGFEYWLLVCLCSARLPR
jgi:hypothetical protein